jgi:hypothetical protein
VFLPAVLRDYPPPLPPREWDPRLDALGVYVEDAKVAPDQVHWRLVKARWANAVESAGRHHIFVEVLDDDGVRMVGRPVVFAWPTGSLTLFTEGKSPPDWPINFPMYGTLGSYDTYVSGLPSDRVVGMGMGTPEQPDFTIHTSFYLTFQRVP